jgi:8-oxo-dGTP pyrophosphatase MutT (NUDIX family)
MMNTESGGPSRWTRGEERKVAETRIFDVLSITFRHPVRGTVKDFTVIDAPDWVNVIALTPDGQIVLVNQFRYGANAFSLEIPGGVIERGVDRVGGGVRELREETGFAGTSARLLASVNPNPAMQDNRCHLVLVEGAVKAGDTEWDPDEEIAVQVAPAADALAWARSGLITHSLSLCGLFYFEGWWRDRGV